MDNSELRDMSDEQLVATLKDTCDSFFRLKMQAQTERLDAPSELRRHRRLVARIKTVQREREIAAEKGGGTTDAKAAAPTAKEEATAAS